jgi:acetyl esterase/lipase
LRLQHHHCSRRQFIRQLTAAMSNWTWSNVSRDQLFHLVEVGQLPPFTFMAFHERDLSIPARRFI